MQALVLESPLLSQVGGGPGGLFQDGKPCMDNEILDGQKLLASSVWYTTYMTLATLEGISPSMETTMEWLRVGIMVEVATAPSTKFSSRSTLLLASSILTPLSTQFTSQVDPTPPTGPPEVYTPPLVNSFPLSTCLLSWTSSSLAHSSLPTLQSSNSFRNVITPSRSPDASFMLTGSLKFMSLGDLHVGYWTSISLGSCCLDSIMIWLSLAAIQRYCCAAGQSPKLERAKCSQVEKKGHLVFAQNFHPCNRNRFQ